MECDFTYHGDVFDAYKNCICQQLQLICYFEITYVLHALNYIQASVLLIFMFSVSVTKDTVWSEMRFNLTG